MCLLSFRNTPLHTKRNIYTSIQLEDTFGAVATALQVAGSFSARNKFLYAYRIELFLLISFWVWLLVHVELYVWKSVGNV